MSEVKETLPFFSVVIPLYNKEDYIGRAISSVLEQRFDSFELIVVDDGSTDASRSVVENFSDPRVRLVCQENRGEGPARNSGMSASKGAWIAFLDGDDMWLPNHLGTLKNVVEGHPDVGIISSRTLELKNGSKIPSFKGEGRVRALDYFLEASKGTGLITSSSAAIRRDVYETLGGFGNFKRGADLEYWARVSLRYSMAASDLITSVYFRGTGGVMEAAYPGVDSGANISPTSLSQISPAVAMLSDRLPMIDKDTQLHRSVVRYINGRLRSAMRGSFIKGDVSVMKALRRLRIETDETEFDRWLFLSACPKPLICYLSDFRRFIRHVYRRFKA